MGVSGSVSLEGAPRGTRWSMGGNSNWEASKVSMSLPEDSEEVSEGVSMEEERKTEETPEKVGVKSSVEEFVGEVVLESREKEVEGADWNREEGAETLSRDGLETEPCKRFVQRI